MRSGCTVMETEKYAGFFDELEKIAEEKRRYVDKDVLKRHLKAVVPVALGAGLGFGVGRLAHRSIMKSQGKLQQFLRERPVLTKGVVAGWPLVGAGIGHLTNKITNMHMDYAEKGDDGNNK